MVRLLEKERARVMRAQGKSYSEIKHVLGIGKGTLSVWLRDMPLSSEQIRQLRDLNPRRIENFRKTMKEKRDRSYDAAYIRAQKDIGRLTKRDLFIAGLHLYWAEGTKAHRGRNELANTDPAIVRAFLHWLLASGVSKNKIRVRLQLYKDMSVTDEIRYWSKKLGISPKQFRKPAIKNSHLATLSRKRGHGHGTCDLIFDNVPMWEYITGALAYLREQYSRS